MTSIAFFRHSICCTQCGEELIAPIRSEYVSTIEVRHSWCCWNCGNEFEMLDHLDAEANAPTELIKKSLPVLIAA